MPRDPSGTAAERRRGPKSERTRQQILDAAAVVFAERGYGETRLSDIAEVVGMRAGSFYYHFPSKDALIDEVLRHSVDHAFTSSKASVARLPASATAGERLRTAITAHTFAALETDSYTAANVRLVGQVPPEIRRRHYERDQLPYGKFWAELFERAAAAGEIRDDLDLVQLRMLIVGSINWSVEWPRALKAHPKEIAETLCAMVFDGLSPRQRERS